MSSMSTQAPADGDTNRGPLLTAIVLAECAVAIAVVGLRFFSRHMIRGVASDDWLMLVTLVLFIVTTVILTEFASIGGCRHLFYLTEDQKWAALKLNWIVQPFAIMSFATSKASVSLVLMRVIGGGIQDHRIQICWFVLVSSALINTGAAVVVFAQCDPPRALWTPGFVGAKCWDPKVQSDIEVVTGSWNCLCDFILAILPSTVFYNLDLSVQRRTGLCILLGLGLFASVSAGIKTSKLSSLTVRSDLTWETFGLWTWTSTETFLLVICGSIPPIKPLYDRIIGSESRRSRTTAGYQRSQGNGSVGRWNTSANRSDGGLVMKGVNHGNGDEEPPQRERADQVVVMPTRPMPTKDWTSSGGRDSDESMTATEEGRDTFLKV